VERTESALGGYAGKRTVGRRPRSGDRETPDKATWETDQSALAITSSPDLAMRKGTPLMVEKGAPAGGS